ncbi:MAG: septation protein A [Pseudomonadota bacterium]
MADTIRPSVSPGFRMAIDLGPLVAFFAVNLLAPGNSLQRILAATVAFMLAMMAAMAISWWKTRHVSPMLWISGVLVLVFGSLTLYFHDETWIKMKPTVVYAMFAIVLGYGLAARKPLLQMLLETAYPGLSERGWRMLTINWTLFFVAMAVLNEFVWRTMSTDFWVGFKLWGVIPLSLIFGALNVPMLMRHGLQTTDPVEATEAATPPEG